MNTLGIFELLAGGASVLASIYGLGRMFYVAATAPTTVKRLRHVPSGEDQDSMIVSSFYYGASLTYNKSEAGSGVVKSSNIGLSKRDDLQRA